MNQKILEIEALRKYYGKRESQTKALDGITFQVVSGEFLGIMGSSGSGKSTLLNCIATVIAPTEGHIVMRGTEITSLKGKELAEYRGRKVGYLFQNFELLDNLTGRENILIPLSLHGIPEKESRSRMGELAGYLEIEDVLDKFPAQMSGGQRQRISIARALYEDPEVLVLDEATSALDNETEAAIMDSINRLHGRKTLVIIAHRLQTIEKCDMVYRVAMGKISRER